MNKFHLIKNFDGLNHEVILEKMAESNIQDFFNAVADLAEEQVPIWKDPGADVTSLGGLLNGALKKTNAELALHVYRTLMTDSRVGIIKLVRTQWGLGLKEAKDVVDNWAGNPWSHPSTMTAACYPAYNWLCQHAPISDENKVVHTASC